MPFFFVLFLFLQSVLVFAQNNVSDYLSELSIFEPLVGRSDWQELDINSPQSWPRNTFIFALHFFDRSNINPSIQPDPSAYPTIVLGYNRVPENYQGRRRGKAPLSGHAMLLASALGINNTYTFTDNRLIGSIAQSQQPYVGGGFVLDDNDEMLINAQHSFRSAGTFERSIIKSFDRHSIRRFNYEEWEEGWDPMAEMVPISTINPLVSGQRMAINPRLMPDDAINPFLNNLASVSGYPLKLVDSHHHAFKTRRNDNDLDSMEEFSPFVESNIQNINQQKGYPTYQTNLPPAPTAWISLSLTITTNVLTFVGIAYYLLKKKRRNFLPY